LARLPCPSELDFLGIMRLRFVLASLVSIVAAAAQVAAQDFAPSGDASERNGEVETEAAAGSEPEGRCANWTIQRGETEIIIPGQQTPIDKNQFTFGVGALGAAGGFSPS
jgi:hypothetical protein